MSSWMRKLRFEPPAGWDEIRVKGRAHYVLRGGLLAYGLPMFLMMTFLVPGTAVAPGTSLTLKSVAISAAFWAVAGIGFGLIMWQVWERAWHRSVEDNRPGQARSYSP